MTEERKYPPTPTPWIYQYGSVYAANGTTRIAMMDRETWDTSAVERDSNAAFIVEAVNAHDGLVATIKLANGRLDAALRIADELVDVITEADLPYGKLSIKELQLLHDLVQHDRERADIPESAAEKDQRAANKLLGDCWSLLQAVLSGHFPRPMIETMVKDLERWNSEHSKS